MRPALGKIVRFIAWFHKWVGIGTCLIIPVWFLSGAIMLFVPFPYLSEHDSIIRSAPVQLSRLKISPSQAESLLDGTTDLRLMDADGTPIYVEIGASGKEAALSGITGRPFPRLTGTQAASIAAQFGRANAVSVEGPFDYDQWVVHQRFNPWRPFFRVKLDDPQRTELYVSARTGEVMQRTRQFERIWNWPGSIVHWMYFVPIRKHFTLWSWIFWLLTLITLLTVAAGIWLGVTRSYNKLRSRTPAISPFRGLLRWHHVVGLTAGIFVLGWVGSGWVFTDNGRLFSDGAASTVASTAYRQGRDSSNSSQRDIVTYSPSVSDMARLGSVSMVDFVHVAGREAVVGRGARGSRVLLAWRGKLTLLSRVPREIILTAISAAWPKGKIVSIRPVGREDVYARAEWLPDDAILARLQGSAPARVYIDGVSGTVLVVMDRSRELYDWICYVVHEYRFPGLASRATLRKVIVLIPLSLCVLFSVIALLTGIRRLRLELKKSSQGAFPPELHRVRK